MPRKSLTEDGKLGKVTEAKSDGSYKIQVISPGLGSSGLYSAAVLEAAAQAKVWPKSTKVFFNHPTATEDAERPARSVKDLAAVLTEDASWDGTALVARIKPVGGLGKTLLENETFRSAVGISVRASAEGEVGEVGGKPTWIVKEIFPDTFNSVDIVTYAGRGGSILESARAEQAKEAPAALLREAAITKILEARNVGQWIESRLHLELTQLADDMFGNGKLTREERIALSSAVGDALQAFVGNLEKGAPQLYERDLWTDPTALVMAAEALRPVREVTAEDTERAIRDAVSQAYSNETKKTYAWLRDYDPDAKLAYFELSVDGVCTTYSQAYVVADSGDTEMTGDKTEVTQRTSYVPVKATEAAAPPFVPVHPAGQSTTTKEHTMPEIEEGAKVSIAETRLRTLEADAGRVPALEAKVVSESARADLAEQDLAVEKAREYARTFGTDRVKEANGVLPSAVVDKIVADAMREIPLTESEKAVDRRLDTDAFGKRVDESQKAEETYLASIVEAGSGHVRGVGSTEGKAEVTEAQLSNIVAGAFGRQTVKGA
jgi:hypothetical protein